MSVQDDGRENELRELFELEKEEGEGRGGNDAVLKLDGAIFRFELKSTSDTSRSVTTVRDFSLDHVAKWEGKHWLIGFYNKAGTELEYTLYGSPALMSGWIQEKATYIGPDLMLAGIAPEHLTLADMHKICGDKGAYTLADARKIHKNQYSVAEYRAKMDTDDGYSPEQMLNIVRERARYLILRGSTLNNPHIPGSYFKGWTKITEDHAETLRRMVLEAIAQPKKLPE
jgi:hypothetical protein